MWKKGRGKLGILQPLLGTWTSTSETEMGEVRCVRTFRKVLDGKWIELETEWTYEKGNYGEKALFGVNTDHDIVFYSFTSDGKHSFGKLADVSDLHEQAVGFEAQMPAGLARQAYWPGKDGSVIWVVESKTKKGWNRFVEHHYFPST